MNEILEEEELNNIHEEKVDVEEEKMDIEKETVHKEKDIVNVEQILTKKEEEIENKLIINRDQVDQKSEINLCEGSEKVVVGGGMAIEIEDSDISLRNDTIATIDAKIGQNIIAIDQDKKTISQDKRDLTEDKGNKDLIQGAVQKKSVAIAKDTDVIRKDTAAVAEGMRTRAENARKLNVFDADKRVDSETVSRAITQRLQTVVFDNVRNDRGVLLRDDRESVQELTLAIDASRQTHPEKDLTKCIEDDIKEWLGNKELCELDAEGNLVPVTPERRNQLAAILSRGVIKEIGFQVGIAQKTDEKNKAEDKKTDSLKAAKRDEHESIVSLVDGHHLDPQFFNTMYKVVECKLFCLDGVELKNVNRLEEMNKENIDLIERIKEVVILKDIIKKDILKTEIEHTEIEHKATVIDGAKRSITNKIYRFDGQSKENVCLRHPTLHPKVK